MCRLEYIQIASWTLLYTKEEWCESKVMGQVSFFVVCY